ncbi:MAG: SLBB domain-containing protein, partial [Lentisphaerae bacterium]|nr:SLBB domain-containing protein [Lentisphaerota bacterium]
DQPVRGLPQRSSTSGKQTEPPDQVGGRLTIQPDSIVEIRVVEDPALDGSYPVNEIGAVELGYVGPVILVNMSEKEASEKIAEVLKSRHFKNATVRVRIMRASYDKIQLAGAVNRPGVIKIGAGDAVSLNDALLRVGGLRPTARGAKVRIVRDGMLSAVALAIDGEEYALMTEDGYPSVPDVMLDNNDVAYVFSAHEEMPMDVGEKEILVLGEVTRRGIYRFSSGEPCTLMHLIFKMNGFPQYADEQAIKIVRKEESGRERQLVVNATRIMATGDPDQDIPLQHGDRVIVPARRFSLF